MNIRLIIVDLWDIPRQALHRLLHDHDGIQVLESISNPEMIFNFFERSYQPPCIVLFHLQDGSLIPMIEKLRKALPMTKVLVLTGVLSDFHLAALLKLEIHGLIYENSLAQQLFDAIIAVANGQYYYDSTRVGLREMSKILHTSLLRLTAREREVLELLCEGCENKEIALRLGISTETAKSHVSKILTKIGVSSRFTAALFAWKAGLVKQNIDYHT